MHHNTRNVGGAYNLQQAWQLSRTNTGAAEFVHHWMYVFISLHRQWQHCSHPEPFTPESHRLSCPAAAHSLLKTK